MQQLEEGQNLRVSVTVIRATESGTRLPSRYSATDLYVGGIRSSTL